MSERLTIHDIARLAGVSTATVSRVLNQKPDVDSLTRERILRIMDEHGDVPDFSAMRLAGNHARKPRLVAPAFPADFLWGAAFDDQWDGRHHIPDKRRVRYLSEHI